MHVIRRILSPVIFFSFYVLLLPSSLAADSKRLVEEAPLWRYTVKPGDNLINIAKQYFVNPHAWVKVQKINAVDDPYRMMPGTVLRIPVDLLQERPAQAQVVHVSGKVLSRGPNQTDWQMVDNGQKLGAGTALETFDDASATLELADGSKIVLTPNSQLALDTLSQYAGGLMADTRLRVQRGQTEIMANPLKSQNQYMRVLTPTAQAFVRGTTFRVRTNGESTHEETIGGLVAVNALGKKVDVAAGYGTVVKQGERPEPPVELMAAPDISALPPRFEILPIRFALPAPQVNQEVWYGQIAKDASFEKTLLEKKITGKVMSFADLPNGDYVLRLRAIDQHGLQGLDAVHHFTVFARPFPPGLNAPGHQATIRNGKPVFTWGKVVDSAATRIQISTQADFSTVLYDEKLEAANWQVPAELPAGPLYWRSATIDRHGAQGPWAIPANFIYKPGPGEVDLGQSALQIESDKLMLRLPPPPEDMRYEIALSEDASLNPILLQASSDDGVMELAKPGVGTYFLGVRLVDKSDNTPGPYAIQQLEITPSPAWLLLLLVPLAF